MTGTVIPFPGRPWQPTLDHPAAAGPPLAPVTLTPLQAQLIASLLVALRAHAPSPKAVEAAVDLLQPRPPR